MGVVATRFSRLILWAVGSKDTHTLPAQEASCWARHRLHSPSLNNVHRRLSNSGSTCMSCVDWCWWDHHQNDNGLSIPISR